MAIDPSKLKVTVPDGGMTCGEIVDANPDDRQLTFTATGVKVGYHNINVDYEGSSSSVEVLCLPKSDNYFMFNTVGDNDSFTEAGVGIAGLTVSAELQEGPQAITDELKWTGGTLLLAATVKCSYEKPLPDGTYKFQVWIRGLSVVIKTVYIIIKNA